MENWFDKNKFFEKLLVLSWIIFLIICLGLLSFTSHASSANSDAPLPYIVSNENTPGWDDFYYGLSHNPNYSWVKAFIDDNNYFGYDYYEGSHHCFAFYFPFDDFEYDIALSNNDYDTFSMTTNGMEMTFYNYAYIKAYVSGSRFYGSSSQTKITTSTNVRFFVGSNKGDGNLLVPNLASQNYLYEDDEYQVVFGFGNPERPLVPTGHATPPSPFDDPIPTTDHDLPREVPSYPTINNYSWTTYNPPQVDTSTLETLTESLLDSVVYNFSYLFSNLNGLFANLLSNLNDFVKYIGKLIEYYGGLIISNLQNLITTFYQNMVSLVENIDQRLEYITEPLDGGIIYDNIHNTSLVSNISIINTALTSFQGTFNDLTEPSSYTIPIHLEYLPSSYFGTQTTQYIDLGIIDPVKSLIRVLMWALITYSLFFTIVDSIANYINGGGDES